jgi:hypothetical protein
MLLTCSTKNLRSRFTVHRVACCAAALLALFWSRTITHAQVVQLAFEKHTIINSDCSPRLTNIVTTSSADVPVSALCTTTRGKFAGNLKLDFPALLANVTNFSLGEPMRFSVGVGGNWTIANKFNEQNFGQANFLTSRVRVFSRPCDVITTNAPPVGVGIFPVEAKVDCSAQFLTRRETSGVDYIVEFESEVELLYRNTTTTLDSIRYTIVSRYRAPGGPYMYSATNLISQTANPRFPLPIPGVTIFNQGTADLHYSVSGSESWLKISQSGTIARGQSASVNGAFDTNTLSARLHRGTIEIKGDGPNSSISVPVELNVLRDSLTLLSIDPPDGTLLSPGSLVRFSGKVEAKLQTAGFADIVFSLRDQVGNIIEVSSVNLRTTTGTFLTNFTMPSTTTRSVIIPATSTNLSLISFLRETVDGRQLAEANTVLYPVGVEDELTQANPAPAVTNSIPAGSTTNLSADVTYFLQSRAEADLALRVFDQNGVLQATSSDPANPTGFLRVKRSDGRKTVRLTTANFTVGRTATNLLVKAVLIDPVAAAVFKNSSTNIYRVGASGKIKTIEFGIWKRSMDAISFTAAREQRLILEAGIPFNQQALALGGSRKAIGVTYDFEARDKEGLLRLLRARKTLDGRGNVSLIGTPYYMPKGGQTLESGLDKMAIFQDPFQGYSEPPDDIDFFEFAVALYESIDEEFARNIAASEILTIPINRIRVTGDITPKPESEVVAGQPATFSVPLELSFKGPQASRELIFEVRVNTQSSSGTTGKLISRTRLATLPANTSGLRHPEVTINVPADANYLATQFFLEGDPNEVPLRSSLPWRWTRTDTFYYHVKAAPLNVQAAPRQNFDYRIGQLLEVTSTSPRVVTPRLGLNDLKSVLPNLNSPPISPLSLRNLSAPSGTVVASSDFLEQFIGYGKYVQFDPPIPENSGFSANLVLRYDRETFPDDPNFVENKIEIVSVDPVSGVIRRYPTIIDQAAQTATASISGLAPYHGLGVFGPFTAVALNLPTSAPLATSDGRIHIVNLSGAAANLNIRSEVGADIDFSTNATGFVTQRSVAAGQMLSLLTSDVLSTNGSWVQLHADKRSVLGWQSFARDGHAAELSAITSHATSVIFPDVQQTANASTELHFANTSRSRNRVTLELYDSQGRLSATNAITLVGKENFFSGVSELFGITNAFTGYLIARASQELSAVQLHVGKTSLTALNAQPSGADNGPVKLHAARFISGGRYSSLLNIVNPTTRSASLRVVAIGETGNSLANPVTLTLAGRQQVQTNLTQLFGLAPTTAITGSLIVESTMGGLIATLTALDTAGQEASRSSFPLASQPLSHGVFPFANLVKNESVEVSVLNPGLAPATVTVKSFQTNGISTASTNFTVAAASGTTRNVLQLITTGGAPAEGYMIIESDQPIFASAFTISTDASVFRTLPLQGFEKPGLFLDAAQVGKEILLSWLASEPAYILQSTDNLGPAANWQQVTNPVTVRDERNTVSVPIANQSRFYRLIKR